MHRVSTAHADTGTTGATHVLLAAFAGSIERVDGTRVVLRGEGVASITNRAMFVLGRLASATETTSTTMETVTRVPHSTYQADSFRECATARSTGTRDRLRLLTGAADYSSDAGACLFETGAAMTSRVVALVAADNATAARGDEIAGPCIMRASCGNYRSGSWSATGAGRGTVLFGRKIHIVAMKSGEGERE